MEMVSSTWLRCPFSQFRNFNALVYSARVKDGELPVTTVAWSSLSGASKSAVSHGACMTSTGDVRVSSKHRL